MIFVEYDIIHYNALFPLKDLINNFNLMKDIEYAYVDLLSENVNIKPNRVVEM